ncbi:MAG: sigma-54 dependent transcriptional regulator [Holosporaceae bacterium]|jgi:transcriptional regulator with PAS, ATPase and Fis domain|nr:sigma-54 dependent transcriptional regulator [Holosporaceae bacterium]
MKIIVIGEKLENSIFKIFQISEKFGLETLFFKKYIKAPINLDDLIVIDSDLTSTLPIDTKNTVVSVTTSIDYKTILKNEIIATLQSIEMIEGIIQTKNPKTFSPIMEDPAMKKAFQIADKVAVTDATVLITGETGTGKEVMAKYIYQKSARSSQKYIVINCAAIPETLLESELFGHEKGAFTGAIARRIGKFEEANHGTILLDEISEIPLHLQAKLLRIIQEKEISRLGGNGTMNLDVRIIATSNRDLKKEILNGRFREDLFYRLNIIPIEIPKLDKRPLDIEPLAKFFCHKYSKGKKHLSKRFLSSLKNHSWTGNIRELENVIYRSVILTLEEVIDTVFVNHEDFIQG